MLLLKNKKRNKKQLHLEQHTSYTTVFKRAYWNAELCKTLSFLEAVLSAELLLLASLHLNYSCIYYFFQIFSRPRMKILKFMFGTESNIGTFHSFCLYCLAWTPYISVNFTFFFSVNRDICSIMKVHEFLLSDLALWQTFPKYNWYMNISLSLIVLFLFCLFTKILLINWSCWW